MSGMTKLIKMNSLKSNNGGRVPIPEGQEAWRNNLYQVRLRRFPALNGKVLMTHLSIKRNGREPIHDWADLQWIKNQLCGPEAEAIELYPAESRLINMANQYHLWVLPPGMTWPVGFTEGRDVGDNIQAKYFGAVQREG